VEIGLRRMQQVHVGLFEARTNTESKSKKEKVLAVEGEPDAIANMKNIVRQGNWTDTKDTQE